MTATVVRLRPLQLECTGCGATRDAACDCGVPYVLASMRAAEAVAKNPKKSDRAIAAEIGVSNQTVSRARKKSVVTNVTPEKRTGKDGKSYPTSSKKRKRPASPPVDPGVEDEIDGEDPENYRTAYLLRADQAIRFATYSGPVTKEIVTAARKAAAAWEALVVKLEQKL